MTYPFIPLRLSPPLKSVRGLDYAFAINHQGHAGLSRLVSTPSHTVGLARRCHGPKPRGFTEFDSIHTEPFGSGAQKKI